MEGLLNDISGVLVYLDDILITGPTDADDLKSLQETLVCLEKLDYGYIDRSAVLWLHWCLIYRYQIDKEGLHPLGNKVQAIQQA